MPDDVKPIRVAGLGIRVSDLKRSKKFYTLGLKVGAKVPAQGDPVEYLLGMSGDIRTDTLIVVRKGEIKPGATDFGSFTIVVPDARKMAEREAGAGYAPAHMVPRRTRKPRWPFDQPPSPTHECRQTLRVHKLLRCCDD